MNYEIFSGSTKARLDDFLLRVGAFCRHKCRSLLPFVSSNPHTHTHRGGGKSLSLLLRRHLIKNGNSEITFHYEEIHEASQSGKFFRSAEKVFALERDFDMIHHLKSDINLPAACLSLTHIVLSLRMEGERKLSDASRLRARRTEGNLIVTESRGEKSL